MRSATVRGALFFGANAESGILTARRVQLVEAVLRIRLVGVYGALVHAVHAVEPLWVTVTIVVPVVPVAADMVEFIVHHPAGTRAIASGVAVSIGASSVPSSGELLARRHRLLLGGPGAASLRDDLWRARTAMARSQR